ncbi:ATP-binding protein [Candidatus Babeliales bacterium]|nr:ATP-binding protein [Candidatus Babeliales bacterium]
MIKRSIETSLRTAAEKYPVLAILGPRQSGKTTVAQQVFPNHKYLNFEDIIDIQEYVNRDPKGFLEEHANPHGLILDEFQNAPLILSYIQLAVDKEYKPGYFILTGSQNFLMNEAISQTLAGRIALFTLLPFSVQELTEASLLPETVETVIHQGMYPRIYAQNFSATWYQNYIRTYLERDVRSLKNITDLSLFQTFIGLCAGRIGQILNVSSLANDCGITQATANSWLTLLQASYLVFLLQPHHKSFSKRLVKSPKIYFYDTGIACAILGIESAEEIYKHYMRGGLTENFVLTEILKQYYNNDRMPRVYFWRDKTEREVDFVLERGTELIPIEVKAGKTVSTDYFDNLKYWCTLAGMDTARAFVVYAGKEGQKRSSGTVLGWQNVAEVFKAT